MSLRKGSVASVPQGDSPPLPQLSIGEVKQRGRLSRGESPCEGTGPGLHWRGRCGSDDDRYVGARDECWDRQ
jgi:hypothetical protein